MGPDEHQVEYGVELEREYKLLCEMWEFLFWNDYAYDPIGNSAEKASDWLDYLNSKIRKIDNYGK